MPYTYEIYQYPDEEQAPLQFLGYARTPTKAPRALLTAAADETAYPLTDSRHYRLVEDQDGSYIVFRNREPFLLLEEVGEHVL